MIFSGCQGKPETKIFEKICPNCGHEIEMFSVDTEMKCENCGYVVYNDTLNCVQWCKYAKQCVGEEMYAEMMKIAARQKKAREEEKQRRLQEKEEEKQQRYLQGKEAEGKRE